MTLFRLKNEGRYTLFLPRSGRAEANYESLVNSLYNFNLKAFDRKVE